MKDNIENIIFSRFVNQPIPFEFISLKELYKRCKEGNYDLSITHRIAFHALIIITKGKSKHYIDFKEIQLSTGTILPLSKNQVHSFNKKLEVEGLVISFEDRFITHNVSQKNLFHFLHIFHTPSIFIAKEDVQTLHPFINILEKTHQNTNLTLKANIINATLIALLLQIKRLSIYRHKTFEGKRFKDFVKFQQLITENYHKTHNALDYANMLSVSYKYLNDICKEINNKTAKSFLDNWLLLEIKRCLIDNRLNSQEIAFKMGFKEPSNFIRFFKKFTNKTPKQFQKNIFKNTNS